MALPDLGNAALLLALVLAAYSLIGSAFGAAKGKRGLVISARNAAFGAAALITVASGSLLISFLTRDFSLKYVAEVSSRNMTWDTTVTSFWGGQVGSLLFWTLSLSLFSSAVLWSNRSRYQGLMPLVNTVLMVIHCFFLFLLVFVSSPFERLAIAPPDGRGLNPLLWDAGMFIHPPLLLIGYMSFSIPFAFAMSALISGRLGNEWLYAVRRWAILSWAIQGAGLLAGAWWAYHVLGWGGYWGWDPVENAALMPWLVATAFIHSIMVQERRKMLKVWNLVLVITAFALSIFGTFVVRSGLLSSVHSFAESTIGPYFFGFLGLILIGSLGVFFYRMPQLKGESAYESVASREVGFLFNNLLFIGIAVCTFWGTVFPLISEMVRGVKISVGPPFYQQANGPLILAMTALMGVGPLLAWRRTSLKSLKMNFLRPLVVSIVSIAALALLFKGQIAASVAYGTCVFVTAVILMEFYRGARARRRVGDSLLSALPNLVFKNQRRYGGYIVHLAIVFMGLAIIGSSFFQKETIATLSPGQSLTIGRYSLIYQGMSQSVSPGVETIFAVANLTEGNNILARVTPERRFHQNWEQQPTTGVVIVTTVPWLDDVYLLLTGWDDAENATFRAIVNPMVSLLWAGGALFLFGTAIVLWPEMAPRRAVVPALSREAVASEV
ncbi:MAG: heme lyase CcmF/NrfE family subunit [Dehalococcoidia bacterium]|nr:heme lyase CcmF/NrfE family subunit [Dehalococcoidia bacterium]